MTAVLSAVTGFVFFAGLVLVTGCVVARWAIVPAAARRSAGAVPERWMTERVAAMGWRASSLLVIGIALYFVRQLLEFRDPFVPWTEDAVLLLTGTPWGESWTWGLTGTLVTGAAFGLTLGGRPPGWGLATPAVLALGCFPAFTGHAAAASELRPLALAADIAHVWAAGAWIGGLAVVLVLERSFRREHGATRSALPWLVPVFSKIAVAAVVSLVLTGAFATWLHVDSLAVLLTSGYGRALVLKLVLVAVALGLGARNARLLTPRLGSEEGDAALRRSAWMELGVAQLVLLATAVLVRLSPMGG